MDFRLGSGAVRSLRAALPPLALIFLWLLISVVAIATDFGRYISGDPRLDDRPLQDLPVHQPHLRGAEEAQPTNDNNYLEDTGKHGRGRAFPRGFHKPNTTTTSTTATTTSSPLFLQRRSNATYAHSHSLSARGNATSLPQACLLYTSPSPRDA